MFEDYIYQRIEKVVLIFVSAVSVKNKEFAIV